MKKFLLLLGMAAISAFCACQFSQTPSLQSPELAIAPAPTPIIKQRGVSWVGSPQKVTLEDLTPLADNHVDWIVQTPFGWQEDYDSPDLVLATTGGYWGETDAGLATTTELARSLGIKTLLKPHIWLTRPRDGKWRTEIAMNSEDDWQTWFANYRRFILHYARFAREHDIEVLCIGTELQTTAVRREEDWRQLIAEIRQEYGGKLTYAANWYRAFEEIKFWDALDFIGIQAYFPLADKENPSLEELKAGWQEHLASIERVRAQYPKPVIFTELGYRSMEDAAIEPWRWPEERETRPAIFATASELENQTNCYEAFFQAVWSQDWFAGVYFWKWFPTVETEPGKVGRGFTPQNKPAEQVMREWYGKSGDA